MSRLIAQTALGRMHQSEVLVHRAHANTVQADLTQLAGITDDTLEDAAAERGHANMMATYGYRGGQFEKPFPFANGIAIIPVHGTLINRFHSSWGYVTGYNYIRAMLNAALEDEDVEMIVLDINSYGGEAAGCFELASEIRDARSKKRILAVVDSNCCSAAYAIGSAATKLIVTPSGQAGSIGVVCIHVDMSGWLKDIGLKITVIAEGSHKADGNPYEALPKDVEEEMRASVKKRYGEFIELVIKNRTSLSEENIREMESRCYRADDALRLKLIDAVQSPTEAVASFLAELGDDEPVEEENEDMSTTPAPVEGATFTQAQLDAARQEGANAERARRDGIMNCEEAKSRPKMAAKLASTTMSVDDAKVALAAAEPEKAEGTSEQGQQQQQTAPQGQQQTAPQGQQQQTGQGSFAQAMDNSQNPNLSQGQGQQQQQEQSGGRGRAAMGHLGYKPK